MKIKTGEYKKHKDPRGGYMNTDDRLKALEDSVKDIQNQVNRIVMKPTEAKDGLDYLRKAYNKPVPSPTVTIDRKVAEEWAEWFKQRAINNPSSLPLGEIYPEETDMFYAIRKALKESDRG